MGMLAGLAQRFLDQDQDLAFSFNGAAGEFDVISFAASEAVNAPFEVQIELASHDPDIDLHALMDAGAALGIYSKYDAPRFLHGIVAEVERGDRGVRRTFYSVTLRPSLHRLDFGSDSRIWQVKTVPDIVKEVFGEYGIVDVDWRLEGTHEPREFCTQHRETHRNFVERLLAEEGIFYFFEHSETAHRLVLTDAPLATPMITAAPMITYNANPGGQSRGSWISSFSQRERLRSSSYEMNDYTFHNPPANQKRRHKGQDLAGLKGDYALYDYPGRYKDPDGPGDAFTKHRIEAVRVDATTGQGASNNIHLCPGYHFELTGHPDPGTNGSQFLLAVSHAGQQPTALEEDAGDAPTTYAASFTTMPGHLPYRPALMRKPIIDGPQIATVTGPEGEEIYCDEHGRIKVQFPWDRYGKSDEHSSCWIRVSQNWAGGTWGHIAIPRIGHEVIVDYLDGDPDQPIVTGRTYHATNKSPYKLPEHKTRMSIKSQTHKGKGYNELRFEDEAGQEEVWVHAQKDMNVKVLNNREKRVDVNEFNSIGANSSSEIGNNMTVKVGGNYSFVVGANKAMDFISNVHQKFTGMVGSKAKQLGMPGFINLGKGNYNELIGMNKSEVVTLAKQEAVGLSKTTTVGRNAQEFIGHNKHTFVAGSAMQEAAKTSTMVAGETWQVACGSGAIVIHSDGKIEIKGTAIDIVADKTVRVNGKDVQIN